MYLLAYYSFHISIAQNAVVVETFLAGKKKKRQKKFNDYFAKHNSSKSSNPLFRFINRYNFNIMIPNKQY